MKNKKRRVTLIYIISFCVLLIVFLFVRNQNARNKLIKEFIETENKINYEFIGELRINEDISSSISQFNYIEYYKTDEVLSEEFVNFPVHKRIYSKEDQNLFEGIYNIEIPFDLKYSEKNVYVVVGSEIESFEIYKIHEDELSEWKLRAYDTIIHYKETYNANYMYFYYIADENLWLFDEDR